MVRRFLTVDASFVLHTSHLFSASRKVQIPCTHHPCILGLPYGPLVSFLVLSCLVTRPSPKSEYHTDAKFTQAATRRTQQPSTTFPSHTTVAANEIRPQRFGPLRGCTMCVVCQACVLHSFRTSELVKMRTTSQPRCGPKLRGRISFAATVQLYLTGGGGGGYSSGGASVVLYGIHYCHTND